MKTYRQTHTNVQADHLADKHAHIQVISTDEFLMPNAWSDMDR
jgi:hypothetical protein